MPTPVIDALREILNGALSPLFEADSSCLTDVSRRPKHPTVWSDVTPACGHRQGPLRS